MASRVTFILVVACLLLTSGAGVVAADTGSADVTSVAPGDVGTHSEDRGLHGAGPLAQAGFAPPASQAIPEADATVLQIRVFENGSAEWAQTVRMALDSEQAETDFAAFRDDFEANRSAFLSDYRTRLENVVSEASTETGREMNVSGFETEIGTEEIPREWGYVTYRLRWDNFASTTGGGLSVGDVFAGGYFLAEGDVLVVRGPERYDIGSVDPEPDSMDGSELQWDGRRSIEPNVTFLAPGGPPQDGTDDTGDTGDGSMPVGPLVAVAVGVTVVLGAGVLYARRRQDRTDPLAGEGPTRAATDDEADDGTPAPGTDGTDDPPDLMTDEDRVVETLRAENGRMRQSALADDLGWSASKTSRVLSDMADEGRVEKLRIGRENVIDLDEGEG